MPESTQVKSKKRVADHGEVFTNPREVNAMLDLVKDESERIDSRFLEPACGDGNFLIEILRRKMNTVATRYSRNTSEFQKYTLQAVSSVYGIELLPDNAEQCRNRLFEYIVETFPETSQKTYDGFHKNLRYLLNRNIVQGDALTYTAADGKPIVFSEWTFIGDKVQRRDFQFDFLVKKEHQYSLFDEQGEAQHFDEPVREFPLVHYTKIYSYETK
ncbi:MAG: SAM-dependent DNA methyltransferase [Bacteroidales bacterium]|nr:SAM-dependent DNA methyltransferase [Bacteroidales bacterium]